MPFSFEWDPAKARSNLAKHGVAFGAALAVFEDRRSLTIPDPRHSLAEKRQVILGRSAAGHLWVVVFTERGDTLRIISARRASRKERRIYEEAPDH